MIILVAGTAIALLSAVPFYFPASDDAHDGRWSTASTALPRVVLEQTEVAMHGLIDGLHALALLIAANAIPVVVAKLTRDRGSFPLDFGHVMKDGERLFGSHKTWRGLASGTIGCALLAAWLGLPVWLGATFALLSLLADAWSSFAKRRLRLKPGTDVLGLDQLGEALLPLLVFSEQLSLGPSEIVVATILFVLLDTVTAPLRHRSWL